MEPMKEGVMSDIRKMGVLKKMKTNKKKFFVIHETSHQGPARIEYYDTEKKFKNGSKANRSIEMRACFNISKKQDTKHKYAIALYTKDDCFSLVMENAAEQEEWLNVLLDLQNYEYGQVSGARPVFDYVWQVSVKHSGIGAERGITGKYRLCLSEKHLGLMKMNSEVPELTFQLNVIRKCGHTEQYFVVEVGRSSPIGAGELLMLVEDSLIAQQMHEVILSAMKAAKASQEAITIRPRTRSSVDKNKPGGTRSSTSPYQSTNQQDQMRARTMSEGQKSNIASPRCRMNLSPKLNEARSSRPSSTYSRSASLTGASPFSSTSSIHGEQGHRYRSDSTGSRGTSASGASIDEGDSSPAGSFHGINVLSARSLTPDGPIREEGADYLTMSYGLANRASGSSESASTSCSSLDKRHAADAYIDMAPLGSSSANQQASDYVDMSAGSISSSKSSLSSTTKSCHGKDQADGAPCGTGLEDSGYLDMTPVNQSLPTVKERTAPEGYLEMTGGTYSPSGAGLQVRPDKVYSYLAEDPQDDFPKRAYSVGSKPEAKQKLNKASSYLESIVLKGPLDKSDQKSSSAPHLVSEKPPHAKSHSPAGSQSPASQKSLSRRASREDSELFMEMTFDRPRTSSESHGTYSRIRTSSWGQNFRPRSSSHSQAQRLRRTPDPKNSSQELKKDSRSSSQEMSVHGSSDSIKRSSHESLKKVSHERQGSEPKRGGLDIIDAGDYVLTTPQKPVNPPLITGVPNMPGEDYLAMSPGSYTGGLTPTRHSPTSLRRSPIIEGERANFTPPEEKHRGPRGQSLTPGMTQPGLKSGRKDTHKIRRGHSADSGESYMDRLVLGFGAEKSKQSWQSDADTYVFTGPKDGATGGKVTSAMLDKVVSPFGASHRNKSPLSVGSHSSIESSDDYLVMETDSSSRLSDSGSTSSGCVDPFQLIRKPEPHSEKSEKMPPDISGLKKPDIRKPGTKPDISGLPKPKPLSNVPKPKPLDLEEKDTSPLKIDPFGLHKPLPKIPDISKLPKPLDVTGFSQSQRSPTDMVHKDLDTESSSADKAKQSGSAQGLDSKPTSPAASSPKKPESPSIFIPGQRRSISDFSSAEKQTAVTLNRSISNQSTGGSEEHKLNYASLDLDSSDDLRPQGGAAKTDQVAQPLQYAEIDFLKSEEFKNSQGARVEGNAAKPPFDFLE